MAFNLQPCAASAAQLRLGRRATSPTRHREAWQDLRQVHGPVRKDRQVIERRTVGDETRLGLVVLAQLRLALSSWRSSWRVANILFFSMESPYA